MSVIYDSKKIIPAPTVDVTKTYQTSGDGTKIGSLFTLVITGTLVAWKGSPLGMTSPGGGNYGGYQNRFWTGTGYPPDEVVDGDERLRSLLAKQKALRDLFSTDGLSLEFTPLDGSTPMKCYPRVQSINFADGIWYNRTEYTITLEADCLLLDGTPICEDEYDASISTATETWTIDQDSSNPEGVGLPATYRLSHTVSATGKRNFDGGSLNKEAWQQAQDYVLPKLGIDGTKILSSGVLNLPGYYGGLNQVRNETLDEVGDTYSVTESWIISSGNALETFEVSSSTSSDSGRTTVNINGSVTGLEERNSDNELVTEKYTNATAKFNSISGLFLTRAQDYSGETLNITPVTTNIGRNPIGGTINYAYEYNDRPSTCITGAKQESISIQDSFGADVFASIFVLGRTAGPVLQNLGAKQQSSRSLNIELVMPGIDPGGCTLAELRTAITSSKPSLASPTAAQIQTIVDAANPANATVANAGTQVFVNSQQETWDYITGRYTYSVEWVYEI